MSDIKYRLLFLLLNCCIFFKHAEYCDAESAEALFGAIARERPSSGSLTDCSETPLRQNFVFRLQRLFSLGNRFFHYFLTGQNFFNAADNLT